MIANQRQGLTLELTPDCMLGVRGTASLQIGRVSAKAGARFIPLNKMKRHEERTVTVRIDPGRAASVRTELAYMGIKHATVYGDLQSVCASIRSSVKLL